MTDTTNTTNLPTGAGEGADSAAGGTVAGGGSNASSNPASGAGAAATGRGGNSNARSGGRAGKATLRAKALGVVQLERGDKAVEIEPGQEFDAPADKVRALVKARFAVLVGDDDQAAE